MVVTFKPETAEQFAKREHYRAAALKRWSDIPEGGSLNGRQMAARYAAEGDFRGWRKRWRDNHPDRNRGDIAPEYWQHRSRLIKYGVSSEMYTTMLAVQSGVCAICKQPETHHGRGGRIVPLAVDHNHVTGKVRGLLCASCNRQLGWYEKQMFAANAYLAGVE